MKPIPIVIKHLKKAHRNTMSPRMVLGKDIFKTTGIRPIPNIDSYGRQYITIIRQLEDDMC